MEDIPGDGAFGERIEPTQIKVEVDRDEWTLNKHEFNKENIDIISFQVPKTLRKARSAFCHDPMFNMAVETYASQVNKTPEKVLENNLRKLLHCRAEMIKGRTGRRNQTVSVEGVNSLVNDVDNQSNKQEVDKEEKEVETLQSVKQEYVEGKINIYEFEDKVEDVLDREDDVYFGEYSDE
jgi:hypothetical protein